MFSVKVINLLVLAWFIIGTTYDIARPRSNMVAASTGAPTSAVKIRPLRSSRYRGRGTDIVRPSFRIHRASTPKMSTRQTGFPLAYFVELGRIP